MAKSVAVLIMMKSATVLVAVVPGGGNDDGALFHRLPEQLEQVRTFRMHLRSAPHMRLRAVHHLAPHVQAYVN